MLNDLSDISAGGGGTGSTGSGEAINPSAALALRYNAPVLETLALQRLKELAPLVRPSVTSECSSAYCFCLSSMDRSIASAWRPAPLLCACWHPECRCKPCKCVSLTVEMKCCNDFLG